MRNPKIDLRGPMYLNRKTGNLYRVLTNQATNKTNANDGQHMVVYTDHSGEIYVREKSEFDEKFEERI